MTREEELEREIDLMAEYYYQVTMKKMEDVCEFYCHGDLVARLVHTKNLSDNFLKAIKILKERECLEGYDFFEGEEDGQALYDEWVKEYLWDEDEDNYCDWFGEKV